MVDFHNQRNEKPRPHLLFADGSRLMRKAAERILGKEFEVILAATPEKAWMTLQDNTLIQVVFVDLDDQANGDDRNPGLIDRIRSATNRRVAETPVVAISDGDDSESLREDLLKKGVTDFIEKPFRPSELIARARAHATAAGAAERLKLLQLQHNRDGETGLGNRRYFFERLGQSISFARRHDQPLSLVHVHLDGLAMAMRDLERPMRLGRMVRLGRILAQAVRQEDTVYRTGPETFSFILPHTDAGGAEAVRCRLVPELDGMGMLEGNGQPKVISRFIVEQIPVDGEQPVSEILSRIRQNMGALLVLPADEAAPELSDTTASIPPAHLENLLELARRGETEQLRNLLPEVIDRLEPLLTLAEKINKKK